MTAQSSQIRPTRSLLRWLAGPCIWAGHFFFMYGAEDVICSVSEPVAAQSWFELTATAATFVAVAALLYLLANPSPVHARRTVEREDISGFLTMTARTASGLSLIGVVWVFSPVLWVSACFAVR
jgi:hypothetical protein